MNATLEDYMHVVAAFAVIAFSVLGSYYLFTLVSVFLASCLVSSLWLLVVWSVYDDWKNDPYDG